MKNSDEIPLDKLKEIALDYAKEKHGKGLLFSGDSEQLSTEFGDSETIYSISSMYAQFSDNFEETQIELETLLIENFPKFV